LTFNFGYQARADIPFAMDRNGHRATFFHHDVVTAVNAVKLPPGSLEFFDDFFSIHDVEN